MMRAAVLLPILLLLPHPALSAQGPITSWAPTRPVEGGLLRITTPHAAPPHDTVPPVASLADEPLHFERDPAGGWSALAAVPLGITDSVRLWVRSPGGADSAWIRIPVAPRSAGVDRLHTDPRFTAPLDSALAERVRREAERVVAALRGSHERRRLWTAPFSRPRPTRVTSLFGRGRTYNGEARGRHRGADFAGVRGAAVQAANRGVVVLADTLYYAGRAVYVDHGAGIVTAYLHLDRSTVSAGDTVARGQVIGRVGASGRVTGPHLHWSAYFGRVAFDPLDLLTLDALPTP